MLLRTTQEQPARVQSRGPAAGNQMLEGSSAAVLPLSRGKQGVHLVPPPETSAYEICAEELDLADQVKHGFVPHPVAQQGEDRLFTLLDVHDSGC